MPPATVTASLGVRLIETTCPAPREPLPGVVAMAVMVGAVGVDLQDAGRVADGAGQVGGVAGGVGDGGAVEGRAGDGEVGGVLAGLDRVVEDEVGGRGVLAAS